MAYFHTTVLDEQIKALPTVSTASGSIATFDTDMTENLVEVLCNITPVQTGSGTPSPSNPRPITVYTSLNLSHSGADTSNPTVYNIPFGQTVAQGLLNVGTGKLRVTHEVNVYDGSENWILGGGINFYTATDADNTSVIYGNVLICSHTLSIASASVSTGHNVYIATSHNVNFQIDSIPHTVTDLKQWLANEYANGTPFTIVYPLVTPIEIQLDSITLQALLNENNIWCDTGDTEVKYLLTVGKAIS